MSFCAYQMGFAEDHALSLNSPNPDWESGLLAIGRDEYVSSTMQSGRPDTRFRNLIAREVRKELDVVVAVSCHDVLVMSVPMLSSSGVERVTAELRITGVGKLDPSTP
jgi:hypothetical protein